MGGSGFVAATDRRGQAQEGEGRERLPQYCAGTVLGQGKGSCPRRGGQRGADEVYGKQRATAGKRSREASACVVGNEEGGHQDGLGGC